MDPRSGRIQNNVAAVAEVRVGVLPSKYVCTIDNDIELV
jgi:hypothetical protein